mmetsp:Transcript_11709/g.26053  ORF Transcript_11709/g.26053 Transcript_11709/m.26053 type:complete len:274 (-) Transcript_11709:109-930(-)
MIDYSTNYMLIISNHLGRFSKQKSVGLQRHVHHCHNDPDQNNGEAKSSPQNNVEVLNLEHTLVRSDPFSVGVVVPVTVVSGKHLGIWVVISVSSVVALALGEEVNLSSLVLSTLRLSTTIIQATTRHRSIFLYDQVQHNSLALLHVFFVHVTNQRSNFAIDLGGSVGVLDFHVDSSERRLIGRFFNSKRNILGDQVNALGTRQERLAMLSVGRQMSHNTILFIFKESSHGWHFGNIDTLSRQSKNHTGVSLLEKIRNNCHPSVLELAASVHGL